MPTFTLIRRLLNRIGKNNSSLVPGAERVVSAHAGSGALQTGSGFSDVDSDRVEALTTRLVDNLRSSIADLVAEVVSSADAAASRGAAGASGAAAAAGGASANDAASDAAAQKAEEDAKRAEALDVELKELKWCHKQVCDPSWFDAGMVRFISSL